MDFARDTPVDGRSFRALTVVGTFTPEALALPLDASLGADRVAAALEALRTSRGPPTTIVVDNGPEFVSLTLNQWANA